MVGDVHGCSKEFAQLIDILSWQSLDAIWTVGDLVDRGPDSAGVIDICIDKNISSVMGNHDQSILNHQSKWLKDGLLPKNADKKQTLQQLQEKHFNYLKNLPSLHVVDSLGVIIVHAGLWPDIPLYAQPHNVIRAQMVCPSVPGKVRWWGKDAILHESGKSEEQNRAEGYERWYRLYDFHEDVIYGHSTVAQPMIYQSKKGGKCIGVDTGSCFGGSITACIYDNYSFHFISVKAEKVYYPNTRRSYWEE